MVMSANFAMWTCIGTLSTIRFILGIATDKKQVRYLILNEMIASMVPNPVLMPKHHFTTIVLTMVMAKVFNFAALETASFTGVKM